MDGLYRIIASSIVILIASIIQGTVGFGFALVAVPLLTLILPMEVVVPLVVSYCLITNIMIVINARKSVRINRISLMILSGIAGIPIGVYILRSLDSNILMIIIGILICVTSLFMAKGYKVRFKRVNLSYIITGLISGVLNGSLSMSGPPIVLFLSNEGYDKNEFRANLTMYATITNIITIIVFAMNGMYTKDMIEILGGNVVALLIGSLIGVFVASKIKEKYFSKLVLILLTIIGIFTIFKSIMA